MPELRATGLDGGYKLLGEFNDTVLAGRETRYGVNFITWSWDPSHTGLSHGNYFMENYAGAKQDFAVRSGAVTRKQIWLYFPAAKGQIDRAILRSGITDPKDMCFWNDDSDLPEEINEAELAFLPFQQGHTQFFLKSRDLR